MSAVDRRRDPASPSTVSTSDLELHHGGALLELCPERAAFRPDREELLVADVHLGKASAFRRAGRPIPHGTTATELERLDALVARKNARRLTFLGDLFHDSVDPSGPTARRFRAWLERRDDLEITLVRGNHDRHAVELIEELPLRAVAEPADASPLAYRHHPSQGAAPHVAGHVHPGVRLATAATGCASRSSGARGGTGAPLRLLHRAPARGTCPDDDHRHHPDRRRGDHNRRALRSR